MLTMDTRLPLGRLFVGFVACLVVLEQNCWADQKPVKLIFDTDMGSDIDDVGALAVLHYLAKKGEVEILGCIYSSGKSPYGGPMCDLINTFFGSADIPVGVNHFHDFGDPNNNFAHRLAGRTDVYHHDLGKAEDIPDMIDVYKSLLSKEDDESVVIVTVGHPIGLYHLMRDTEGARLGNAKVDKWIAMAPLWNFSGPDKQIEPLAEDLLARWKRPFYLSPVGQEVITGHRLVPLLPRDDPVRESYRDFIGRNCLVVGRPSWDQIAVLFAVRPELFDVTSVGSTIRDPKSTWGFRWSSEPNRSNHFLVEPKLGPEKMGAYIEDLMTRGRLQAKESAPAAHQIPGLIQAEEYDQGAAGIAYHDTSAKNEGGQLRPDGVDIGPGDGNWFCHAVGWTRDGEWLRFTTDIAKGSYTIELHVASSSSDPGVVTLEVNDTEIARFDVAETGGSDQWKTLDVRNVDLPHVTRGVLKMRIKGGGFKIDWLRFRMR